MSKYDPELAKRVWGRVQSASAPAPAPVSPTPLSAYIAQELAAAHTYRRLSGQFSGKAAETLRQLAAREQAHANCLQGICRMENGACPQVLSPAIPPEAPAEALRRCYQLALQSASQYAHLAEDPRYGHAYRSLAQQEQETCRQILELLGTGKTGKSRSPA